MPEPILEVRRYWRIKTSTPLTDQEVVLSQEQQGCLSATHKPETYLSVIKSPSDPNSIFLIDNTSPDGKGPFAKKLTGQEINRAELYIDSESLKRHLGSSSIVKWGNPKRQKRV